MPEDGYVFSMQEYAQIQRGLNPWVNLLSSLIVSEPFVIAGTSLFEPDLEYFFAHRSTKSEVVSRAPSILVEPNPDAGTEQDCARLGLILVRATLVEFVEWILAEFGPAPTPLAIREPQAQPRLVRKPSRFTATAFWTDFHHVSPSEFASSPGSEAPLSAFLLGRPPAWEDIATKVDIPLQSQLELSDECRRWLASEGPRLVICLHGLAGSGKSTSIRRVGYELAGPDFQVFSLKARDGLDIDSAVEYLELVCDPILLVVDSLAEASEDLSVLLGRLRKSKRVLVLAAERDYRRRYIEDTLECDTVTYIDVKKWRKQERVALIENYVRHGLAGTEGALLNPARYAGEIDGCIIAEAVCRILNDFRPLKVIARSLWNDSDSDDRSAYLAVAITHYCYPQGNRRSVIASAFTDSFISAITSKSVPLKIVAHPDDAEFLIPANGTLAALLVEDLSRHKPEVLLRGFVQLGKALAPFVTRSAIRQHTAEARLAGRLFDADGVVRKLLRDYGDAFYKQTQELWKWNSRYWEQRALYTFSSDQGIALQYARHAVAVERHPFPMTTLSKILFALSRTDSLMKAEQFAEALDLMRETFRIESGWERGKTRTAYWILFDGVLGYFDAGGILQEKQKSWVAKAAQEAIAAFGADRDPGAQAAAVQTALSK